MYEKGSMNFQSNKSAFYSTILLLLMMFSCFFIESYYIRYAALFVAVIVALQNPIMLIVPLMVGDTMQGVFMVNDSLSFNLALCVLFIFGYIIKYRRLKLERFDFFLLVFSFYNFLTSFWSITNDFATPISLVLTIIAIILIRNTPPDNGNRLVDLFEAAFVAYGGIIFILSLTGIRAMTSQFVFDSSLNANTISCASALSASVVFGISLYKERTNMIPTYLFMGMCTVTILFAGSRTSLLALFLAIIVGMLLSKKFQNKKHDWKKFFSFVVLAGVLIVIVLYVMSKNVDILNRFTFSNSNYKDIRSISMRTDVWKALWEHVIPDHLFLGVGYGLMNVKTAVAPYVPIAKHAHNIFFAIFSETGLIGLALYSYFFLYCFRTLFSKENRMCTLFITIIPTIFFALFNGIGEEMINQRWMWLSFGLIFYFMNCYKAYAESK